MVETEYEHKLRQEYKDLKRRIAVEESKPYSTDGQRMLNVWRGKLAAMEDRMVKRFEGNYRRAYDWYNN